MIGEISLRCEDMYLKFQKLYKYIMYIWYQINKYMKTEMRGKVYGRKGVWTEYGSKGSFEKP